MQEKIQKLVESYGEACYQQGNMAAQYENEGDVIDAAGIASRALDALAAAIHEIEERAEKYDDHRCY